MKRCVRASARSGRKPWGSRCGLIVSSGKSFHLFKPHLCKMETVVSARGAVRSTINVRTLETSALRNSDL